MAPDRDEEEEPGDEEFETDDGQKRYHSRGSEDGEQAQWLARELKNEVRYDHTAKRWHVWNGLIWAPDKTKQVHQRVEDLARQRITDLALAPMGDAKRQAAMKVTRRLLDRARVESALEVLSWMPGYKTDGSDWDSDPYFIGCANGIVDLRTSTLITEPTPDMLVSKTTGINYVPKAKCPRFEKFLDEITSGDPQLSAFYVLWFGYSLFGLTEEQRFLILTGIGRNGKGALVTVMRYVFGDYYAKADSSLYMKSRFGSARSDQARADLMALRGGRLAVMSEPDGGAFNTEMLKAHTGGDPITARALNSNNVLTWEPTHSITFLTNQPPSVEDIGPAMAARVMVADFRERYEGDREDKKLYDKLRAEGEGVLAWLVDAARLWWESRETGGLAIPERVKAASAAYLVANDPLGQAMEEWFAVEEGAQSAGKVLYDAYCEWFARANIEGDPMSKNGFSVALEKRGFKKYKDGKGYIMYRGIRPRSAIEIADGE